jgi:hypothetical protein
MTKKEEKKDKKFVKRSEINVYCVIEKVKAKIDKPLN